MSEDNEKLQDEIVEDDGADLEQDHIVDNDTEEESGSDKSFTQEELNEVIKDRLAREKLKWEKSLDTKLEDKLKEKQRLSEMSDEDRERERMTELEKQLVQREQELVRKELFADTETVLRERSLPTSLASFVVGEDSETTLENVKQFQTLFEDAVKVETKNQLAGVTPSIKKNKKSTITKREILDIRDPQERREKIAANPHLFQK